MMVIPMEIYLLRHGIAEDRSATGRDADRRLTEEGRAKLRRVLERAPTRRKHGTDRGGRGRVHL